MKIKCVMSDFNSGLMFTCDSWSEIMALLAGKRMEYILRIARDKFTVLNGRKKNQFSCLPAEQAKRTEQFCSTFYTMSFTFEQSK